MFDWFRNEEKKSNLLRDYFFKYYKHKLWAGKNIDYKVSMGKHLYQWDYKKSVYNNFYKYII